MNKNTQPPAKWTLSVKGETNSEYTDGKGYTEIIKNTLIEQLQSEAVEKFKREATNTSYLDVIKREREEARADERKKVLDYFKYHYCMVWSGFIVNTHLSPSELHQKMMNDFQETFNKLESNREQPVESKEDKR